MQVFCLHPGFILDNDSELYIYPRKFNSFSAIADLLCLHIQILRTLKTKVKAFPSYT